AQAALQMGLQLGQRLDGSPGKPVINQLVGLAVQNTVLTAMDPNSPYGDTGQTVKDQLDKIVQERTAIQALAKQFEGFQDRVADRDWISYKDRWHAFGEEAALR